MSERLKRYFQSTQQRNTRWTVKEKIEVKRRQIVCSPSLMGHQENLSFKETDKTQPAPASRKCLTPKLVIERNRLQVGLPAPGILLSEILPIVLQKYHRDTSPLPFHLCRHSSSAFQDSVSSFWQGTEEPPSPGITVFSVLSPLSSFP